MMTERRFDNFRLDEDGVGHYEVSRIDGQLEDCTVAEAIAWLEQYNFGDARIERYYGYDSDWLVLRWTRKLEPEELAKMERDARERDARHAAERQQSDLETYRRLKARFEPE